MWSRKQLILFGLGIVAFAILVWTLNASGLAQQVFGQARVPGGSSVGVCYSDGQAELACRENISLEECGRVANVDTYIEPTLRFVRNSLFVFEKQCRPNAQYVTGHGQSIVSGRRPGETAYTNCVAGELEQAIQAACPNGVERVVSRALLSQRGWTQKRAKEQLGITVPPPPGDAFTPLEALYRAKCGAVVVCVNDHQPIAALPEVPARLPDMPEPNPELVAVGVSRPAPCQDEQVVEYAPPLAPAVPGPFDPNSIQPGEMIVHTLPCPPAAPVLVGNQPVPAVGSLPEIFVSAPEPAAISESSFLCRFADTWWVRLFTRITPLECGV